MVPTTDRDGPISPDCLAAVTSRSSNSLMLRSPDAPARPFSQVTLSASSVTEMACLLIYLSYIIYKNGASRYICDLTC